MTTGKQQFASKILTNYDLIGQVHTDQSVVKLLSCIKFDIYNTNTCTLSTSFTPSSESFTQRCKPYQNIKVHTSSTCDITTFLQLNVQVS
jgi:hypothetical protein